MKVPKLLFAVAPGTSKIQPITNVTLPWTVAEGFSWQKHSLLDGKSFPLVLTPPSPRAGNAGATADDLEGWTWAHRHDLLTLAQDHGAVLLRGFDVPNPTRCAGAASKRTQPP